MLLLQLINQVIDLRKLDQEKLSLQVSEFDLVLFVEDVVDNFRNLAKNSNGQGVFYGLHRRPHGKPNRDVSKPRNLGANSR